MMNANILKTPSGAWTIVGFCLPVSLCYVKVDGSPLSDQEARRVAKFGPCPNSDVRVRVFPSEEDAREALESAQVS